MSENTVFYYEHQGASQGPVRAEGLIELAKAGTINRDTSIWRQGYEDWKKLSETEIDVSFLPPPMKPATPAAPPPVSAAAPAFSTTQNKNIFMDYFINVITQNYVNFKGRARRKEYWFFYLFATLFCLLFFILDAFVTGIPIGYYGDFFPTLTTVYGLALFLPSLGVTVRRLHDIGNSGWLYLIILIPLIGSIIFLVFSCLDSQRGENKYGPNPKGL